MIILLLRFVDPRGGILLSVPARHRIPQMSFSHIRPVPLTKSVPKLFLSYRFVRFLWFPRIFLRSQRFWSVGVGFCG